MSALCRVALRRRAVRLARGTGRRRARASCSRGDARRAAGGGPRAAPRSDDAVDGPGARRARCVLAPVAGQEVWAAGVTYAASAAAAAQRGVRAAHDFYDKVYDAERPELFFKAAPGRVRGPGGGDRRARGLRLGRARAGAGAGDRRRRARSSATRSATTSPRARSRARTRSTCRRRRSTRGSCALGPALVPVAARRRSTELRILLDDPPRRDGAVHRRGADLGDGAAAPTSSCEWLFAAHGLPGRRACC